MSDQTGTTSWTDRLFGGFRKTSERLTENLSGIVAKTRLTLVRGQTARDKVFRLD